MAISSIIREKASAIIDSHRDCVLALIEPDGYPVSSIVTVAQHEELRWFTFGTGLESSRAHRIRHCNHASACFTDGNSCITLIGDMEILTDLEAKKAAWYEGLANHFTGPEDPNFCVLKLHVRRANLFVDWQDERGEI